MKSTSQPVQNQPCACSLIDSGSATLPWEAVRSHIEQGSTYWLSTVTPDGRPHTVPILAVWADDALHFAAGETTRKARNIAWNAHCVVATDSNGFDIVVEGKATKVCDDATLERVAGTFGSKFGWHVTVRDGAFHDADGAPTAGPPPYEVYRLEPARVFAFGTDEATMAASTRWRF